MNSFELFDFVKTEISYKQKDDSSEKEILELKERVRDLEDKLKKSENRTYDKLGTGQRLHVSSRQIIEDGDTDHDTSEQRNREKTPSEPEYVDPLLLPIQSLPSNPGSPPRRVKSPSNEGVRKLFFFIIAQLLLIVYLFATSLLNVIPGGRLQNRIYTFPWIDCENCF